MKNSGIIRQTDKLGRVVIPVELRRKFGIEKEDSLEIFIDGSNIVLKKFESNCIFCGSFRELSEYKNRLICKKCLHTLKECQKHIWKSKESEINGIRKEEKR